MSIIILAIESSCDDTSASIVKDGIVLSNITATQRIHEEYGGVVPEAASRRHEENIIVTVNKAVEVSKVSLKDLSAIAVTRGPGLLGSLIVGTSFAKGLSLSLDIPIIEVNHMSAHVLAHFAEDPKPEFPFLCLTVSGGHTQIVKVDAPDKMIILGQTRDDAAGEAFDKSGKLLGLGYPAGPMVDKLAKKGKPVFDFPVAKIPDLNFSFSGLKTAIRYFLRDQIKQNPSFIEENLNDICASIQSSILKHLMAKLKRASKETGITEIAIAGGVSANSGLRSQLIEISEKLGWNYFIPDFQYCTDNAGMIGIAAQFKFLRNNFSDLYLSPQARMKIETV